MTKGSRWPARFALLLTIVMFGAVLGAFDAFGMPSGFSPFAIQTSASPTPTQSSTPCQFSPAPPPLCPSSSAAGTSSASPTPSGSTTPAPGETHAASLTIDYNRGVFSGEVRSAAKCETQRKIVLRKVRKGPDRIVGRDTTNAKGKWAISVDKAHGKYYAKALKRIFTEDDHEVTCKGATSDRVRVV
jgi:hypothetical protein